LPAVARGNERENGEGKQMATLTDAQRTFLDEPRYAVVATINPDGTPQQTVLWYERQGDAIMMNMGQGRIKNRNLQRDARISFCIEDAYRYLTLRGIATLDTDPERAQADIARIARRYTPADRIEQQIASFRTEDRVTIRMTVEHIDARGI